MSFIAWLKNDDLKTQLQSCCLTPKNKMQLFRPPNANDISHFLVSRQPLDFSYPASGFTDKDQQVLGYDNDHNRVLLGHGPEVWRMACQAIRSWKMFPGGWAYIRPERAPLRQGEILAMIIHLFGVYWLNPCRIVYTIEEERRFGFAYGTLPGHIECGEERFSVEWLDDDSVWYDLKAFSRPSLWLVKLGYPVARRFQRRFVKESLAAMQRAVRIETGELSNTRS